MSKQNIISLLQEDTLISPSASLTLVKSILLLADILTLQTGEDTEHCSSTAEPLNLLILAHGLTIKAVSICWCFTQHLQILSIILTIYSGSYCKNLFKRAIPIN